MGGCWTCRARKKRCGQQTPSCNECDRLGLECDGYGARPAWADGGQREHSYKMRLKEGIKRRHQFRRTKSLPGSLDTTKKVNNLHFDNIEIIDDFKEYFDAHFAFPSEITLLQTSSMLPFLPAESSPTSSFSQDSSTKEFSVRDNHSTNPYDWSDSHLSTQPVLSGNKTGPYESSVIEECQLLSYYMDSVYWRQYPHLDPMTITLDRSWILALFHSSRVFKEALLQVSRYLRTQREYENPCNIDICDGDASHELLEMIRNEVKDLTLEDNIHGLQSTIALIAATALTAYHGTLTRNQDNIHGSLLISRTLLGHIRKLNETFLAYLQPSSDTSEKNEILASALRTSYAQLLWLDTFEAATTSSLCFLELHPPVDGLHAQSTTEALFGCRSWIIHVFRQVTELGEWKKSCLVNGRLSVLELYRRSQNLLEQIDKYQMSMEPKLNLFTTLIPDNDSWTSPRTSDASDIRRSSLVSCEDDVDIITRIYAQAITTYLHIIVSGANPGLLEIQSAVTTMMTLVEQLRCVDTLACVLWPLMISSCLSTQTSRERCRGLLTRAMRRPKLQKECSDMLHITQKFWRLAGETPTAVWDWENVIGTVYGYNSPSRDLFLT